MRTGKQVKAPTTRFDMMCDETAADPWPRLRELREMGPLVWHETLDRWLVTTDREVRDVIANYRHYTVEETTSSQLFGEGAFISIDSKPSHDALRLVWAEPFRMQGLVRLRAVIKAAVDELLAPVAERLKSGQAVDLHDAVCRPLPTLVIAHMMGIPRDMIGKVVAWTDEMASGPGYLINAAALARREEAKSLMAEYLLGLMAERRRKPTDDLISSFANAEAVRGVSDEHAVQNVRQLLFAGNETTAKWLAHIFLTLGQERDVQREVAADRSLVIAANDEVMRWQGVVGTLVRKVRGGPVALAGVPLQDGELLTCLPTCANRDPARFDDPDRFDIHRPPQPNLGFGAGMHHCLGINLAKMEAEEAVNGLLDCAPGFAIAGPFRYSAMPLRGPLPVTIALDAA
jgi:cytochrome P450